MKIVALVLLSLIVSSSSINASEFTSLRSYSDIIHSNPDSLDQFTDTVTRFCLEDALNGYAFCLNQILHLPQEQSYNATITTSKRGSIMNYDNTFSSFSDTPASVRSNFSLKNFNDQRWHLQQDSLTDEGGIRIFLFR